MPPILHGVIREGRWPFSATGSESIQASGGYGLSAEAQLYRYALIRNIQGGWRKPYTAGAGRRPPPYLFKTYAFEPFVGLKDTDLCTRKLFFTRLKEETVVRRDEVAWYTAKTFNAGWGLR